MGVVAFQLLAFAGRFSSERTAVERSGAKRAEAALDMLASVHTQAMMHRTGIDGNDGAIATLNGTMEQFSESGSESVYGSSWRRKSWRFRNYLTVRAARTTISNSPATRSIRRC